jgi:hypothetical protein
VYEGCIKEVERLETPAMLINFVTPMQFINLKAFRSAAEVCIAAHHQSLHHWHSWLLWCYAAVNARYFDILVLNSSP